MAENKQERKTFKWGDQEYYLDDLLKLHADQEHYYYNFARDKGSYDDEALTGLRRAIASRIQAVKDGKAFEADGTLDTDAVDNIKIQTQKKGLLKKAKYVDQDNTEWAKYYLNQLVKNLKSISNKTEDINDYSKYNFASFFKGQGLSAKDIFEKYDLRDESNPDAPRSFNERDKALDTLANNFVSYLEKKNLDYTKNDDDFDDDYLETARRFATEHRNMSKVDKAAVLRKLGAGEDIIQAFTSDKWDLSTDGGSKSKKEADKKKNAKEYNDTVSEYYKTYEGLSPRTAQMTAYLGQSNSNFYRTPEELLEWAKNTKGVDLDAYQKRYNENKWDAQAAQYILPMMQANGRLREAVIDGTKYVYDPNSIDRTNHSFIAIDPISGQMTQRFLYDIENEAAALRNKYLQSQGAQKYQVDVDAYATGGALKMQTGGEFNAMEYLKSLDEHDYEDRAKAQGISVRELKEQERTPLGEETIINNSEFNAHDWFQIGTMAADITSIFLDPVSGAAVGVASSVGNFINDATRDGFQADDGWNLVKNLGMDALGVIPIIGDSFGTLGKVKKGLVKLAPKIIGYLSMASGIANTPQILDSFSKILDDRDMTTADWQNIANGLTLIATGTRIGKHALREAKAKKASLKPDMLQVEVTNKAGDTKMLVLDGDNAKAVKESDHSVDAVNQILHNIDGFKDYQVSPKSTLFGYDIKMPGRKVTNPTTNAEERVFNPFEAKTQKANIQSYYDPVEYARAYTGKRDSKLATKYNTYAAAKSLNGDYTDKSALGKTNLDTVLSEKQKEIDLDTQQRKERGKGFSERTTKRKEELNKVLERIKNEEASLKETQEKLTTANEDLASWDQGVRNIETWQKAGNKAKVKQRIQDINNEINQQQKKIKRLRNKPNLSDEDKTKIATAEETIKKLNEELELKNTELTSNSDEALESTLTFRTNAEATSKTLTSEKEKLDLMLQRLRKKSSGLNRRVSMENPYLDDLLNPKEVTITFNGENYTLKPTNKFTKEDLTKEGIFKQGGSIDRNKINKFLSYAKG